MINLACEIEKNIGEGAFIGDVDLYDDLIITFLRRSRFSKDRILPIYLFLLAVVFVIKGEKVKIHNYVPLWAFWLHALGRLERFDVGTITGSVSFHQDLPAMKLFLQRILNYVSLLFLSKKKRYCVSTVSVFNLLDNAGFKVQRRPFYVNVIEKDFEDTSSETVAKSILIYTYNHWAKGNDTLTSSIDVFLSLGMEVHLVGMNLPSIFNNRLIVYERMSRLRFEKLQRRCEYYYNHSYEEGGITAVEMLQLGKKVLLRKGCGLHKEFESYPLSFHNTDDLMRCLSLDFDPKYFYEKLRKDYIKFHS